MRSKKFNTCGYSFLNLLLTCNHVAKACLSSNVAEHLVSFSAIHMKLSNLYAVSKFDLFSLCQSFNTSQIFPHHSKNIMPDVNSNSYDSISLCKLNF